MYIGFQKGTIESNLILRNVGIIVVMFETFIVKGGYISKVTFIFIPSSFNVNFLMGTIDGWRCDKKKMPSEN